MPTYLIHGFRWPRPLIRIHIILQNLDDAAAEWICSPTTTMALLQNFVELFPHAMPFLPQLRFIEQYDPSDLSAASLSQPHAYVADIVEEVKLGVDVDEVRGKGVGNEQWGALMEIRDKIAPDEKVGWWVVVCGDEERWAPPTNELSRGGFHTPAVGHTHEDRGRDGRNGVASSSANETQLKELRQSLGYHTESEDNATSSGAATPRVPGTPESRTRSPESPKRERGMKKWFGNSLRKTKSKSNIREISRPHSRGSPPPPLPTQRTPQATQ